MGFVGENASCSSLAFDWCSQWCSQWPQSVEVSYGVSVVLLAVWLLLNRWVWKYIWLFTALLLNSVYVQREGGSSVKTDNKLGFKVAQTYTVIHYKAVNTEHLHLSGKHCFQNCNLCRFSVIKYYQMCSGKWSLNVFPTALALSILSSDVSWDEWSPFSSVCH